MALRTALVFLAWVACGAARADEAAPPAPAQETAAQETAAQETAAQEAPSAGHADASGAQPAAAAPGDRPTPDAQSAAPAVAAPLQSDDPAALERDATGRRHVDRTKVGLAAGAVACISLPVLGLLAAASPLCLCPGAALSAAFGASGVAFGFGFESVPFDGGILFPPAIIAAGVGGALGLVAGVAATSVWLAKPNAGVPERLVAIGVGAGAGLLTAASTGVIAAWMVPEEIVDVTRKKKAITASPTAALPEASARPAY